MKKILLIDDEPQLLSTISEILTAYGYEVIALPDAESAYPLIREGERYDLVITDLHLPGMNGSELIGLFRKIMPNVPVIVLTGYATVESYIQTRCNGVFEYINKPIRAGELRRIVGAALNGPFVNRSVGLYSPESTRSS